MSCTPFLPKPIVNTRDAIASYVRWKVTLLSAARMQEPLSERATHSVQHPGQCAMRRWLLARYTLHLRQTPEYRVVLRAHQEFYRELLAVAILINTGQYALAEEHLNRSQSFRAASSTLADAILALDRIAPVSLAS